MKKQLLFLVLVFAFFVPLAESRVDENITDITEDGWINTAFVEQNNQDRIEVETNAGVDDRGFIQFNISSIPDTAIVDEIVWSWRQRTGNLGKIDIYDMQFEPNTTIPENVWGDAHNGSLYAQTDVLVIGNWYNITLSADASVNMTSNLAADWFALGLYGPEFAKVNTIYSSKTVVNASFLTVKWHLPTDFAYTFSGPFFENGNTTGPITVTAAISEGNEDFIVDGTPVTHYFPVEPLIFYWSLGGGTTRRIYSIGEENITVTIPDDTFDTFTFTVRDFTNKLSRGDAYLEAYRIVATNDTLIERMFIDVHNEVPMNLVVGATYSLRVRFYDNTSFIWGYFVSGQTLTTTIVLRGVDITDQAYLVGNFLSVEITRPITTQITVDYLTSRNTTIWSNVTVLIRNGAVISTQSYAVEGYTFNLAGLDANTSYTVLVEGEHTLQTEWAYSKSFDGTETYPDVPNIENIFPMGALESSNLISWVFVLASGLTFSVIYKRASLIVMCAMASFFSAFGFADWNFYLLSLCWFFAVVVYLGSGD